MVRIDSIRNLRKSENTNLIADTRPKITNVQVRILTLGETQRKQLTCRDRWNCHLSLSSSQIHFYLLLSIDLPQQGDDAEWRRDFRRTRRCV